MTQTLKHERHWESCGKTVSGAGMIRENARQTLCGQGAGQPSSAENSGLEIGNNAIEKKDWSQMVRSLKKFWNLKMLSNRFWEIHRCKGKLHNESIKVLVSICSKGRDLPVRDNFFFSKHLEQPRPLKMLNNVCWMTRRMNRVWKTWGLSHLSCLLALWPPGSYLTS